MRDIDEDGAPDNPGSVLWYQPTRTGQKDNYNLSLGVSATWSIPQDKNYRINVSKQQMQTSILCVNNMPKRLDFEIARLKNCMNHVSPEIHIIQVQTWWS